ncbi:phosphohydrolase [Microvirga vignae]|uniref:Phosphohydrolase n=1 Tax=Microvirga vignae TaxID=1225564 RepID=A0A0H1R8L6_9HYPH|nr:phosphohydrolase [Microvirga vignae]KLK91389.1 phosphohydrolase [Microvirga vignae]
MSSTTQRRGDWIQTYSGAQFWPMDPRAGDIRLQDIAHALSMLCRYTGHCKRFYSVAEHSVLLSEVVEPKHRLWALLHDASEAYLVDVPRPVKPFLTGYREAEGEIMLCVAERFGLSATMPKAVKEADNRILTDEATQNMSAPPVPWSNMGEPLGVTLRYWSPERAEREFLEAVEAALVEAEAA